MNELVPFLQKNEIWIYLILGLAALFPLLRLISAWRAWQGSLFGLEREIAQRRFSASLTVLALLVLFIFAEFILVLFVAPNYPQVSSLPTPTLDLLATHTVTLPSPLIGGVEAAATQAGTPTVTSKPLEEGCTPGQVEWVFPSPGQEVGATVELKGTVNVPNLGFYKYEYSRPEDDTWTTIAAGNQPKVDGVIGFWNTSQLPSGDYRLRLVVADNQNNLFPACVISLRVIQP